MDAIRHQVRSRLPPTATIKLLRRIFALPAPAARLLLDDITKPRKIHRSWYKKVPWNGEWSGCWIGENLQKVDDQGLADRIAKADIIIFNVHGGGFRVGKSTMYLATYIKWIRTLKEKYGVTTIIMSVDYRLAPEFKFPSPVEDVVRAYECLIKTYKVDGSKIIAAGDSNGSSLVLEMLFITHDPSMFEIVTDDPEGAAAAGTPVLTELPRPAGTVLISPLVTDETTSQSWKENVKHDYVSQNTAKLIKKDYFHPLDPNSPADSQHVLGIMKLQTGFRAFFSPRVLLFIGNKEVMRDDALDLGAKAEQDGVDIEIVMEDCVHDWFCVREVVKDKTILDRADAIFSDFVYRSVILTRDPNARMGNGSYASNPSLPRDGLHAVPEINEDEEDEFHEAMTDYTDLNSTTSTAVYERYVSNEKGTRTKTLTVFV
ncbi:alpha/beta-hydrolase [Hesseltinella vesiculosa]|uniref:Alpha/beta-hydrolase n=1 Tax=Hesseltinella vesiculosa TaxID=101127 RepID=A0A1X2GHQ7_9FUNG|nr:alpha/beta-hydrolase [Hesseltinella vesiculosa]